MSGPAVQADTGDVSAEVEHTTGSRPRTTSHRRRVRRWHIVLIVVVLAALFLSLYLLEVIPLTKRSFSITVATKPIQFQPFATSVITTINDEGTGYLSPPTGSDVSFTWKVGNDTVIALTVLYGGASYVSNSTANGTFHLEGGSPFISANTWFVWFDVFSPYPVNVTFQGTYTVPFL
jgi:hypothetical protein